MTPPGNQHTSNSSRATKLEGEILDLIVQTSDPRDKAMLLVLYRLNENAAVNTSLVRGLSRKFSDHQEEFRAHVEEEKAILNQGRGMYRVLTWVFGAGHALAMAFGVAFWNHDSEQSERIAQLQRTQAVIQNQLKIVAQQPVAP